MARHEAPPTRSNSSRKLGRVIAALSAALVLVGCDLLSKDAEQPSFAETRRAHSTRIVDQRKAPTQWDPIKPIEWLEVFDYESEGRTLHGYKAYPKNEKRRRDGRFPLLFYLHGSFAIAQQDIKDLIQFLRDGYAVYAPAYRAENGQPGQWELWYGELDDARNALDEAIADPRIDSDRVYVFGHGAGGVLASLMTLYEDLPARDTGSAGGIYTALVFDSLDVPFADTAQERRLRMFLEFMDQMKQPHFACVGKQDSAWDATNLAAQRAMRSELPYQIHEVPGGHVSSLPKCLAAYHQRINALR